RRARGAAGTRARRGGQVQPEGGQGARQGSAGAAAAPRSGAGRAQAPCGAAVRAGAMTILLLMDSPEYLRFYDSAIEELVSRGHEVALAVNSGRAKKPVGLEGLQQYADRVRVLGVVPQHEGRWAG